MAKDPKSTTNVGSTPAAQTGDPGRDDNQTNANVQLERSTYDIIRNRLSGHATDLRSRLDQLNTVRRDVFGAIESKLLASDRISTAHNCVARDMVAVGDRFVFGYNVHLGLKSETDLADVFAVHSFRENTFHPESLELIEDPRFLEDFVQLFRYFKNTRFANFFVNGPNLYMVFQTGKAAEDIKVFKWAIVSDGLKYIDARSESEVKYPLQHEFRWVRTRMDQHRTGEHPHVSIQDRIFVETVGGDLTIKVEDNTSSGCGIYAEDVKDPDQGLGDAEIFYAIVGDIILLKIRPYQEDSFRYIVYSEKVREARRVDAIENACVLLPEDHGLIFSNGYYLQTGEHKTFDSGMRNLMFYRRVMAPNGEDYLYVFYNRGTGTYVLLSYNVIERRVMTPIVCHGYSLFENGRLVFFKSGSEPQKHHALQIWQTPYVGESVVVAGQSDQGDSYLFKIGNQDVVRGMADCHEIVALAEKDDSFANLYMDLVKKTTSVLDAYFWMKCSATEVEVSGQEQVASSLGAVLTEIRDTAKAAVDEFDKVQRVRQTTGEQTESVKLRAETAENKVRTHRYESIEQFVESLAELRSVRGEIVGLRELRYVDGLLVDELDASVAETSEALSQRCVEFLLQDDSLTPYEQRVAGFRAQADSVTKVAESRELEATIDEGAQELDMLIDIVSNLKIDDATQRTQIVENISTIYARLNQVRAGVKKQAQQQLSVEGEAEFHSQIKLLEQSVINYLDVCDTPEKCDEYLTKLMVQVEELEGRFAEFEGFLTQLVDRRQEIYATFDGKKVALVEARNRKATSLATVADRIFKGIETRVGQLTDINDIHSYFAADVMVDKVRNLVDQLLELEDSVKVDDIQSRLKTVREDAIRQLKDRQELYIDGENVIQLGKHKFSVNTQSLDLTTVMKDDQLFFHLTGTNYMEPVTDEALLATRGAVGSDGTAIWSMTSPAENAVVYRGEFLAYRILIARLSAGTVAELLDVVNGADAHDGVEDLLLPHVQNFMATRHNENYTKGIHDHDATRILRELLVMHTELGAARYSSEARALAVTGIHEVKKMRSEAYRRLVTQFRSLGAIRSVFGDGCNGAADSGRLRSELREILEQTEFAKNVFSSELIDDATDFVLHQFVVPNRLSIPSPSEDSGRSREERANVDASSMHAMEFSIGQAAEELCVAFTTHLQQEQQWENLNQLRGDTAVSGSSVVEEYRMLSDWLCAFAADRREPLDADTSVRHDCDAELGQGCPRYDVIAEAAAALLAGIDGGSAAVLRGNPLREIRGMVGDHSRLQGDAYTLDYHEFMTRMSRFETNVVPQYEEYVARKREVVEARLEQLRLDEFRPRVLTSFVRNRLIDEVYLPMIGDNLAKQIGVVGEQKRTDLMGMLLLISPPGYGKTTLMEYVANRLGITFMKINGPAIGHQVTSLDPAEAPNASAREEIEKLNLALEMGDNVMLYIDDIQHCHPEFLQKFISLCDAQRKIEGVFQGRTRRYDLRGRKVVVVMAGNPYTESGHKFQIPDMLTSRADTYNLGDVTGSYQDAFELSYLENAITSNPALSTLASRSHDDVCSVIRMAETGSKDSAPVGINLDGNYSDEQLTEFTSVIRKLVRIRETVLQVNSEYIRSAAQADDYRTEPAFKLQGSYRDMNKMAEAVVAIMNDEELDMLVRSHYQNQAQTLTGDAEANLLKLRELRGNLTGEHVSRWEEIKSSFQRNVLLGAAGDDKFAQVVGQMMDFRTGLDEIRSVMAESLDLRRTASAHDSNGSVENQPLHALTEHVASLNQGLSSIRTSLLASVETLAAAKTEPQQVQFVYRVPKAFLDVIRGQFAIMQGWLEPIIRLTEQSNEESQALRASMEEAISNYRQLIASVEQAEMIDE